MVLPGGQLVHICLIMIGASAARVRMEQLVEAPPPCAESVPGSVARDCQSRMGFFNSCKENMVCKCPIYAQVKGDNLACQPFYASGSDGRKFDPNKLLGKGCKCVTPLWVPTSRKVITYRCPKESYFSNKRQDLPDLAATALEWCNSQFVPEDRRLPKSLRGIYWMKGGHPADVAFCTTRAEWDAEKRTAVLSPWTDFVWRKRDDEIVPKDMVRDKKLAKYVDPFLTLTFSNDTLKYAAITAEVGILNWFLNAPLVEVDKSDDGLVESQQQGDVFARPTSVLGKRIGMYFAVRIVDDEGNINPDWYKMMEEAEHEEGTSFVRYEQDC